MLKHYVSLDEPGALFPESSSRCVRDRIPAHLKDIPECTYALHFYSREEVEKQGETLVGKNKARSVRVIFGKIHTLEEIAKEHGTNCPLYRNIERAQTRQGILCNTGNWQVLLLDDIVLEEHKDLNKLREAI